MFRIAPWLTLFCALALAGCGGGSDGQTAPAERAFPRALAQNLAAQADAIAETYDGGDVCSAAKQADQLLASVEAAIGDGRVPDEFQDPLTATANDLVNEINCPEQTTTTTTTTEERQIDCDQLEEEKKAVEEEKEDAKGKGHERRLQEQIDELEQQIEDCKAQEGDEGDE